MGMLMDNPTKEWRDVDPTNINVTDEMTQQPEFQHEKED